MLATESMPVTLAENRTATLRENRHSTIVEARPAAVLAPINNVVLKSATLVTRAVNHKLRRQIITLLDANKRMHVSDIYSKLKLQQSVTSQHLALMRRAGIVETNREGRNIFYLLNYARLAEVANFVEHVGIPVVED